MKNLAIWVFLFISVNLIYSQIYVSTDGNDDNPGTVDEPFGTFEKAVNQITPGDTIYVRGGIYNPVSTISISFSKSGKQDSLCTFIAYNDEIPILDFSGLPSGDRGIRLQSNYWHIKGLQITNATDNGMIIDFGSYNIIENCQFYRNQDTGLQLANGSSYNQIINCDSYYNADPPDFGDADGFAPKLNVGTGNYFYGCRAWGNCDDGWDGYMRGADDVSTTLENCWTWGNGYLEDGTDPGPKANGNGFKLGGGDNSNSENLKHHFTLINCLAFDNKNKGFDQNNNAGSMTLYNCSGYNNLTANYRIQRELPEGQFLIVKNSLSYFGAVQLGSFALQEANSWLSPFEVTAEDFLNLDIASVSAPRKEDGSLPEIDFLHLAQGSDLIDGGIDLGFPYLGAAPDLGAFESDYATSVNGKFFIPDFRLAQNYPNPFNPTTKIEFSIAGPGNVTISVYNVSGQLVEKILDEYLAGGEYSIAFNAQNLSAGLYFYTLSTKNYRDTKKMLLVK